MAGAPPRAFRRQMERELLRQRVATRFNTVESNSKIFVDAANKVIGILQELVFGLTDKGIIDLADVSLYPTMHGAFYGAYLASQASGEPEGSPGEGSDHDEATELRDGVSQGPEQRDGGGAESGVLPDDSADDGVPPIAEAGDSVAT